MGKQKKMLKRIEKSILKRVARLLDVVDSAEDVTNHPLSNLRAIRLYMDGPPGPDEVSDQDLHEMLDEVQKLECQLDGLIGLRADEVEAKKEGEKILQTINRDLPEAIG